jgi:GNAT superfamily N-acetyltransferase
MESPVAIAPLSPDRLSDLLAFFEGEAFTDNPAWSSCYCQCFYEDHRRVKWSARTAVENRDSAVARCSTRQMQGYLAYAGHRVVGWCNAAPRHMLHALDVEAISDAQDIGCILCFLVAPSARGTGVARSLLAAACDGLRTQGLLYAEANPRPDARTSAEQHFGPLPMYLSAGFAVDRTDDDGSVWVRKRLGARTLP